MALYLDLQPAPQFDSSLVTYAVVNFQRIKSALLRANTRVTFQNFILFGPWGPPVNQSFTVPYKSDIYIWSEATAWVGSPGFHGIYIDFDGGPMFLSMDQYWNETGSHKAMSVVNIMRNIQPGSHYVTIRYGDGLMSSDGNDRCRLGITFYEVM
jgi:hypothetical protein